MKSIFRVAKQSQTKEGVSQYLWTDFTGTVEDAKRYEKIVYQLDLNLQLSCTGTCMLLDAF